MNFNKLIYISNKFPLQGTDEWINMKKNYMSGTLITTLKNKRKYNFNIFPSKLFTGNKATAHGNYYEKIALRKYEIMKYGYVQSLNFIPHAYIANLGFSPDGYDIHNDCLIEIKCPYTADLFKNNIKKDHYDQMQLGLQVLRSQGINTYCNYVVYDSKTDVMKIRKVEIDTMWYDEDEMTNDIKCYFEAKKDHDLKVIKLFL